MRAKVVILNGQQAGQVVQLQPNSPNMIGREAGCEIRIDDPACSRIHAGLSYSDLRWQVADEQSANGTYLNGEKVEGVADVGDGDKLLVGGTWLKFLVISMVENESPLQAPPTWVLEDRIRPESSLTSMALGNQNVQRKELDCLERVSAEISHQTEPEVLVRQVLKIIVEHLRCAGARLLWHNGRSAFAEYVVLSMPVLGEMMTQQAMATSEAVLVPLSDGAIRSRSIFAPLRYLDRAEGVIWVVERPEGPSFSREDLCLVASIAHVLAPPLRMLLDVQQLQRKNESLLQSSSVNVVGRSAAMQRVLHLVSRVADLDQTVLLRGESGVGKEVVARLIHETGARREKPMVCVNCAALTETLLESELFGHEKGAFTGAVEKRRGKFELADGGTIFLDELGSMLPSTQAKLLRVLDGHPFERIGGQSPVVVDVRVIGATNADLETMVSEGAFRADLYHRLRVVEIAIPPLRERREDVLELAEYFLRKFSDRTGRQMTLDAPSEESLLQYDWPGNVRQLRNVIEQAAILSNGSQISVDCLGAIVSGADRMSAVMPLEQINRAGIERALTQSESVPAAAKRLGLSRSALYRHMKKLSILPPRHREPK